MRCSIASLSASHGKPSASKRDEQTVVTF
jgi:hypothetical protein